MNLFSNIRRAGKYFLPTLLAFGLLTACSDDEVIQTPLDTPNVTNSELTVSSLTFTWDAVPNVSSYSCELSDPNGIQVAGLVTTSTTARFTGLLPNTTYTLNVYAYAAIGSSNTTSRVATLTATTASVIPLRMTTPTVSVNGTNATITWDEVEYAVSYTYSYLKDGETVNGSVTEPSLTLRDLPLGTYRVAIAAVPDEEDEAHSASPEINVEVNITSVRNEVWRRKGTYYSYYYDDSWDATLVYYSDNTYAILAFYDAEGYNLEFSLDSSEGVQVQNYKYEDEYYKYVTAMNYSGEDYDIGIYEGDSYVDWSRNTIYLFTDWGYDDYDTFTWTMSIDDLVGDYTEETSASDYVYDNGVPYQYSGNTVTISKVDDSTITLSNFYWSEQSLTGTVDFDAHTITFAAGQTICDWGLFAGITDKSVPVVATFDANATITIKDWTVWGEYSGEWYTYVENAVSTLTKQH